MQQSIQSEPFIQLRTHTPPLTGRDSVVMVPTGVAWFDVLPPQAQDDMDRLTVVIYPDPALLQFHQLRMEMLGIDMTRVGVFSPDLPPHAERSLWDDADRGRITHLMMTATKLQSVKTLGMLNRLPNLDSFILEQGHWVLPDLWGPFAPQPYNKLPDLFQTQWQSRPPLMVLSYPMSLQHQARLLSAYGLAPDSPVHSAYTLESIIFHVKPCMTEFQKYNALKTLVNTDSMHANESALVICQSMKQAEKLHRKFNAGRVVLWHRKLPLAEKDLLLQQLHHMENPVIITDAFSMHEIPRHIPPGDRRVILWQMPWSCDALLQHMLIPMQSGHDLLKVHVLYTREDFQMQRETLGYRLSSPSSIKPIAFDQLAHIRQFLVNAKTCRKVQINAWLFGTTLPEKICGECDVCLNPYSSSLWRNLLRAFLY